MTTVEESKEEEISSEGSTVGSKEEFATPQTEEVKQLGLGSAARVSGSTGCVICAQASIADHTSFTGIIQLKFL